MAVRVVEAAADQRGPRLRPTQQGARRAAARAVVPGDEHVEPRNPLGEDQLPFDVRVGVAGQERDEGADAGEEDDPRAVRIVAPPARREERPQLGVAADRAPTLLDRFQRHAAGRRLGAQRRERRIVERGRRHGDRADVQRREDFGAAARMVAVGVADDEIVDPRHAPLPQRAQQGPRPVAAPVVGGVEENGASSVGEERRRTLADVEDDETRRRRGGRKGEPAQRPRPKREDERRERGGGLRAAGRREDRAEEDGEREGAPDDAAGRGDPSRAGPERDLPRDEQDPARRAAPDGERGGGERPGGREDRDPAGRELRQHRRRGEDVRGNRPRPRPSGGEDEDRPGREGRRREREGGDDATRQPGHEDDRGCRRDGQRERQRRGERRVEREEDQRGEGEGGRGGRAAAEQGAAPREEDGERGPPHGRIGRKEEEQQRHRRQRRRAAPRMAASAERRGQRADDERRHADVEAGDDGDVGQPGGAHRAPRVVRYGVADAGDRREEQPADVVVRAAHERAPRPSLKRASKAAGRREKAVERRRPFDDPDRGERGRTRPQRRAAVFLERQIDQRAGAESVGRGVARGVSRRRRAQREGSPPRRAEFEAEAGRRLLERNHPRPQPPGERRRRGAGRRQRGVGEDDRADEPRRAPSAAARAEQRGQPRREREGTGCVRRKRPRGGAAPSADGRDQQQTRPPGHADKIRGSRAARRAASRAASRRRDARRRGSLSAAEAA